MTIKVEADLFDQTKLKQKTALEDLSTYYEKQQNATEEVTDTWEGKGGDYFRAYIEELVSQTRLGIHLITSLNTETQTSQANIEETDRRLSASQ